MKWRHHKKNSITMVYGFERDDTFYDVVLTLHKEKDLTHLYGFLSRIPLDQEKYKSLYDYIQNLIETPSIQLEIVPALIPIYKHNLSGLSYEISEQKESQLFSGQKCVVFKVKMK